MKTEDIAIIGLAAAYPGAKEVASYWQNILNKVDAVKEMPDDWALPFYDPDSTANDRMYTRKAGFLGDLAEFNPAEFGTMPSAVEGGQPDQYLALKLARDALWDAGYQDRPFNREKTGVILGHGNYMNHGYGNMLWHGSLVDQLMTLLAQLNPELTPDLLARIRRQIKDHLPPFNTDMAPGLVPNNVTGRIANRLDLMGPNYIVDAACSASLLAVEAAMRELWSGRCDMMLTGGVHAATVQPIMMLFCQLGALSRHDIRPFDAEASGTILGGGAGILVLKRLRDAERDQNRIYAVIKGAGSSSDGKGLGLLAPRFEGECLALKRAYEGYGIDPKTVELIEAHGTGIPLGDKTEIRSLTEIFGGRQNGPQCAIGSVKSMISHCLTAAGAASLIKTALALHHRVLPPTLCNRPHPALALEQTPFYINTETRPWIHHHTATPRRAGVNAFGFGGINAHLILEEYTAQAPQYHIPRDRPYELLLLASPTRAALIQQLKHLQTYIQANPETALLDIAYTLFQQQKTMPEALQRLAIITTSLADLDKKIVFILEKLQDPQKNKLQTRSGIYFQAHADHLPPKSPIALLFPGEGSQYQGMLADLCLYFPVVRQWLDTLDQAFPEDRPSRILFPAPTGLSDAEKQHLQQRLFSMDMGSATVFGASMALYELLQQFGIKGDVMLGHSTGENTALLASGMIRIRNRTELISKIRELNGVYTLLEQNQHIAVGVLLTVGAIHHEELLQFIAQAPEKLWLAMDNCPNQAVIFGSEADIATAMPRLKQLGGLLTPLPFNRAYHTPLFEPVAQAFAQFYKRLDMGPGHTKLYSCASMSAFPVDSQAIRKLAVSQWSSRVRFRETISKLYQNGIKIFLEVGPNSNLSNFVKDILGKQEHWALASNVQRQPGLAQLFHLLAPLWVQGQPLKFELLYEYRSPIHLDFETMPAMPKAAPVLNLTLPTVSLDVVMISEVQQQKQAFYQAHLAAQAPVTPAVTSAAPPVMPALPKPDSSFSLPAAPPLDPRPAILSGHFALMQQFLQSQAQLWETLQKTSTTTTPAPTIPLSTMPLLGTIRQHQELYLESERIFTLEQDLFLHHHTLGGQLSYYQPQALPLPVIPFTFSMEIVAEAAIALTGHTGYRVIELRQLRGSRWLALDQGRLTLRIQAHRATAQSLTVQVRIYQMESQQPAGILVFEGQAHLAPAWPSAPAAQLPALINPVPAQTPPKDLYKTGMFHGPMLQGVTRLVNLAENGIEGELTVLPTAPLFRTGTAIFYTDAGLMDAAGQLVGYWLMARKGGNFNCFPFQVAHYQAYRLPTPGEKIHCRGIMQHTQPHQITADFELFDAQHQIIARLSGWSDRYFEIPQHLYRCRMDPVRQALSEPHPDNNPRQIIRQVPAFPDHFLSDGGHIWQRVLAHLMLTPAEKQYWYALPETAKNHWLLGHAAAKDALREWLQQQQPAPALAQPLAPIDIELQALSVSGQKKWQAHCAYFTPTPAWPTVMIDLSKPGWATLEL